MDRASNLTEEIARTAFELFQKNYNWEHPIRSLGVRGCDLVSEEMPYQLDLFMDETKEKKSKRWSKVADEIVEDLVIRVFREHLCIRIRYWHS